VKVSEGEESPFSFLERCVRNCLKEKCDLCLPNAAHVARAIILLADGESRNPSGHFRFVHNVCVSVGLDGE